MPAPVRHDGIQTSFVEVGPTSAEFSTSTGLLFIEQLDHRMGMVEQIRRQHGVAQSSFELHVDEGDFCGFVHVSLGKATDVPNFVMVEKNTEKLLN